MARWRLLLVIFVVGVALDQWTKYLAVERLTVAFDRRGAQTTAERVRAFYGWRHLEPYATEPYVVFPSWWRMAYAENPGAAWGIFRGASEGVRLLFFGTVAVGAAVFVLLWYRRLGPGDLVVRTALSFVLAGDVGNFIDRLARGYVVDFVEWHWWKRPDLRWPTFNVADSLIVVGVVLLVLWPQRPPAASAPAGKA